MPRSSPADPDLLSRRTWLAWAAGVVCSPVAMAQRPPRDGSGFRIPGEFEPLSALWLGYDAGHEDFSAALITALQGHVKLKMLVRDAADLEAARAAWQRRGIADDEIDYLIEPQAIYFVRDSAVFTVGAEAGRLGVVDFRWTHYGLPSWCRRRYVDDAERAALCEEGADESRDVLDRAVAALAEATVIESKLAIEGGGVESNGQGLLIANEALWLARNPALARAELEAELLALPGVRKVLWLPEGLAQDPLHRATIVGPYVAWGTGGHTDEFVRFADERTVLLAWPEDADVKSHPVARLNLQRMQRNLSVLSRTRVDGKPLRVIKVPLPRIVERRVFLSAAANTAYSQEWTAEFFPTHERRREGDAVMQVASTSYLNFVIANRVVLLPDYVPHGTPRAVQLKVQRIFERAFAGREIRFIDAIGANWVGGGAHCATLSEPRPTGAALQAVSAARR